MVIIQRPKLHGSCSGGVDLENHTRELGLVMLHFSIMCRVLSGGVLKDELGSLAQVITLK